MTDVPSSQDQASEIPAREPLAGASLPPAERERSKWAKMLTPLVLAGVGLVMLVVAFIIYPSTAENPTPGYSELIVNSSIPINYVFYVVNQVSAATARISVTVALPPGAGVPAHGPVLQVWLPIGDAFANCPAPACRIFPQGQQETSYWIRSLTFTPAANGAQATTDYTVRAPDFGVTFNGIDASAAIPEVKYFGPENPEPALFAGYATPSADRYDWSSYQPEDATSHSAVWQEDVSLGDTASRVAVGINHSGQSRDDTLALVAGTLLGLGGGAILSAVQEALHARD